VIPGAEEIEQCNWPEAEKHIKVVAESITQIAAAIDRATAQDALTQSRLLAHQA
jgi:hypothetical protein